MGDCWIDAFLGTIAQFKYCDLRHRKILHYSFTDLLKEIQLPSKEEDTDACVEEIMHQKSTSLFLNDLLALMSATISSADMSEAKPPKESKKAFSRSFLLSFNEAERRAINFLLLSVLKPFKRPEYASTI